MNIPDKLQFVTDGNIIELVETIERENRKKLPEPKYVYKYIVGRTKIGLFLTLTESHINKLLDSGIARIYNC